MNWSRIRAGLHKSDAGWIAERGSERRVWYLTDGVSELAIIHSTLAEAKRHADTKPVLPRARTWRR